MLSHTRMGVWDVPYTYGPIYAYRAEHVCKEGKGKFTLVWREKVLTNG